MVGASPTTTIHGVACSAYMCGKNLLAIVVVGLAPTMFTNSCLTQKNELHPGNENLQKSSDI